MSGHAKELRRIADDQDAEAARQQYKRDKCPVAAELRDSLLAVVGMVDEPGLRDSVISWIGTCDGVIGSGTDITNKRIWLDYEEQCREVLAKAEAVIA